MNKFLDAFSSNGTGCKLMVKWMPPFKQLKILIGFPDTIRNLQNVDGNVCKYVELSVVWL